MSFKITNKIKIKKGSISNTRIYDEVGFIKSTKMTSKYKKDNPTTTKKNYNNVSDKIESKFNKVSISKLSKKSHMSYRKGSPLKKFLSNKQPTVRIGGYK